MAQRSVTTTRHSHSGSPPDGGFEHEALFYSGPDGFGAATVPFIRAGLQSDEAVLVVVSDAKIRLLREALGDEGRHVEFADMAQVGHNPARIIPAWRRFAGEHAKSGRHLRGIGEPIWAGRSEPELVECQRHESLLNLAFADSGPFQLLCPYDIDSLPDDVIDEARRSHPYMRDHAGRVPSPTYAGIQDAAAPFAEPLPPAPPSAPTLTYDRDTLHALRAYVAGFCTSVDLIDRRREDLVTSVSEIASNSIRHGGGHGTLRIWRQDGGVVCELRDAGRIDAPLAGRELPPLTARGGRGLWMTNQLCDLVQIRSPNEGTVVRLHVRVPTEPPSQR